MEIKRYKFLIGNVNTDIIDITHNSDLIGNQRKEIENTLWDIYDENSINIDKFGGIFYCDYQYRFIYQSKLYRDYFQIITPFYNKKVFNTFIDCYLPDIKSLPKYFYHKSPTNNRQSILKNGLIRNIGKTTNKFHEQYNTEYLPDAIFLYNNMNYIDENLFYNNHDIYKIPTSKLDLSKLIIDPAIAKNSFIYFDDIRPEYIKLLNGNIDI
jgi:hypothetical protein